MKIAAIGQKNVPSREGGIEVVVTELSKRMVGLGHSVYCYNRYVPVTYPNMKRRDVWEGVHLVRVRTVERVSLNAILYAVCATFRAVFGRYDVIHLHAAGPASMTWLPHLLGIPTVVTIHGLDWQRAKWGKFASHFLRFGERMAARCADEVIVLTHSAAQYFQQTYQRECRIVPNGITVPAYHEAEEITRRWGLKKGGYILFLARLVPEKGIHYLLEAYKQIDTDCPLVIAGALCDSEYVNFIKQKAQEDSRVILTDFVTGQVLQELLWNADIFTLPSDVEGLSLSVLEAMGCGLRCLLSDIPENYEAAGDLAHYFKHGNVESLRDELQAMLDQKDTPEAAQTRRAFIRERYNWDVITARTLEVYQQANAKRARQAPTSRRDTPSA